MKIDWIEVNNMLPPEPIKPVENLAKRIDSLEEGELEEYLVTIKGAVKATTLYYTGNGKWWDAITQNFYPVVAWSRLPEAYKGGKNDGFSE
jgi:hypothetical protein